MEHGHPSHAVRTLRYHQAFESTLLGMRYGGIYCKGCEYGPRSQKCKLRSIALARRCRFETWWHHRSVRPGKGFQVETVFYGNSRLSLPDISRKGHEFRCQRRASMSSKRCLFLCSTPPGVVVQEEDEVKTLSSPVKQRKICVVR